MVKYQMGNFEAFQVLHDRHAGRVLGYLKARGINPTDAQDLSQNVFVKLHENRAQYSSKFPFLPWVFTITRHVFIDFLRKKKSIPTDSKILEFLVDSKPQDKPSGEDQDWVNHALSTLPQAERDLIRLRFEEGLSFEAMAKKMNLESATLRKRVSRLLGTLSKKEGGKI